MKNNLDRWSFIRHPTKPPSDSREIRYWKPPLTSKQVEYWKRQLSKVLKVGTEFEFNLPTEKNGSCKGNNNSCPCALMETNDCWMSCINSKTCIAARTPLICTNRTDTCEAEDCATCEHFVGECKNITCPNFATACFTCTDFVLECDKCKFRYDPAKNPNEIRQKIINELEPNNSYGVVSKSGVCSITTDGSLLGKKGVEVITVGRRIDYWEFYNMAKQIINVSTSRGAFVNERCSLHMHVLAAYYGKVAGSEKLGLPTKINEMEKPLPEIVMANLHQLVRKYQNAITWMTMGLDDPVHMTRWEKFRVSVLPVSAVYNTMMEVREEVASIAGGNKYGWINYNNNGFDSNGNIKTFHVEFRGADCVISPSVVAALACMYYGLVIKAVEISRYGIVEVGDNDWLKRATEIKEAMLNNTKPYDAGDRFANTSKLSQYYNDLISESLELTRQLKHILIKVGPAYEVLEKLAEKPIALRRCASETWEDIEKEFAVIIDDTDILEIKINEFIDLRLIEDCKSLEEWIDEIQQVFRTTEEFKNDQQLPNKITKYFESHLADGEVIWSTSIGAPIKV